MAPLCGDKQGPLTLCPGVLNSASGWAVGVNVVTRRVVSCPPPGLPKVQAGIAMGGICHGTETPT